MSTALKNIKKGEVLKFTDPTKNDNFRAVCEDPTIPTFTRWDRELPHLARRMRIPHDTNNGTTNGRIQASNAWIAQNKPYYCFVPTAKYRTKLIAKIGRP